MGTTTSEPDLANESDSDSFMCWLLLNHRHRTRGLTCLCFLPPQTGSRGRWSCCSSHRASPPLPSLSLSLWVSLSVLRSSSLPPYPEQNRASWVSPLANLRLNLECEIKWNPIRTNKFRRDPGLCLILSFFFAQST